MTPSYTLGFVPIWYIADLTGKPLGGGYLATTSSLNPTVLLPVFTDPAGLFPWPYVTIPNVAVLGILFNENGSQGPFYFKFDPAIPSELYNLEAYDSEGILQWTVINYNPASAGGGGVITTALSLQNFVANNYFWRNIGATLNPIASTFVVLAPSVNTGLAQTTSNLGPDICFIKNNVAAADQIQFLPFTPAMSTALTPDVTPPFFLRYTCTNTPAGETSKFVQFPITAGVTNFSNQDVTITIWARVNSGPGNTLTLNWLQFFGDGASASPPISTPIGAPLSLLPGWNKFPLTTTVPSVVAPGTGNNLGGCGNDGLFLQVNYPLGTACSIDFTKPSLYLGSIPPVQDYETYDMINAIIDSPRTGDVRTALNLFQPYGWVPMNDGTIGNATSGANTRANIDTFPLYNVIWNNVADAFAPVTTGRGVSAVADFTANKSIKLTLALGRVLGTAGQGTGLSLRTLGEFLGEETHILTIPEIPSHHHTITGGNGGTAAFVDLNGTASVNLQTGDTGGGGSHNNMQPTTFLLTYLKL